MATWEDGPEYAPLTRPREFAPAPDSALDMAPEPGQPEWTAPAQRPVQYQQHDLPPLSTLIPDPGPQRDASQPFDVVASNMTGMGALGGPAGGAASGQSAGAVGGPAAPTHPAGLSVGPTAAPVAQQQSMATAWNGAHWSPPAESSWTPPELLNHSDPQRPFETSHQHQPQAPQTWPGLASLEQPRSHPQPDANPWPPQGDAAWLGPATQNYASQNNAGQNYAGQNPATQSFYAPNERVAVPNPQTPGEFIGAVLIGIGIAPLICLALGLFPAVAPLTLIAAFFLRRTGTLAKALISKFYFAAIGIVVVGTLASLLNGNTFYTALSQASFVASLLLLLASFLAVSMALRSGRAQPPPPSQWG